MKKMTSVFLAVILLSLAVLSSCHPTSDKSERDAAIEILDKVSQTMDGLYSYEADGEIEILAYASQQKMKVKGNTKQIYSKDADGELYHYARSDASIKYGGVDTLTSSLQAFNDGKFFYSYSSGDEEKKMYYSLSESEYMTLREKINVGINILDGYSEISLIENEDKTYEIKLWGYDKKITDAYNAAYGFPVEVAGGRIIDFNVTLLAGESFLVKEVLVEYKFSNIEFIGSEKITYSNYNKAKKNLIDIEIADYDEVDDAGAGLLFDALLLERKESASGTLEYSHEQNRTFGDSTETYRTYFETYDISYGVENGGYHYTVDASINGMDRSITYKDGVYKEIYNAHRETNEDYTDFMAKKFVDGFMNPLSFSAVGIDDVKRTVGDDGIIFYELTISSNATSMPSILSELYNSVDATYVSSTVKLEFTVENGRLTSVKYTITSIGKKKYENYNMFIDITTNTRFCDDVQVESPEA